MSSTFAALKVPNYRIYLTGSSVSNIGTWMQRVAQDWLVLELSGGSGTAVGITTALQFLPTLFLSAYGGLIADRFDKRVVLRFSQTWMALSAAVLGVLAVTGVAETWHVFVLALSFGMGSAIDVPARQAFVSEVVGTDYLANAIGLNSAMFHSARIIGPALAGLVIHSFGSGWAILSNAVTYIAFILALGLMNPARLQSAPRTKRGGKQIREGLRYVRQRSDILLVLFTAFFVGTFGLNFQMTSALMAQQQFHKGAQEYGLLGTFMAVGSLAGALISARRSRALRGRQIVLLAVAFGLIEMVNGMMPTYWTFAASLPLVGLASLLTMNASNTAIQMSVDPKLRGRVMALYMMVLMGGTPIGAPILGWVGEVFGPRWTLIGGGGMVVIGVVVSAALLARRQGLEISPQLRPRPHFEVHRRVL